jgi:hypothetical protein
MADTEPKSDPVAVLQKVSSSLDTARRSLREINELWAKTSGTAKEIARNELCRSLGERLQLAEREAAELIELVELSRKT